MKCVNCGGQIGLDVEKCPYCNSVNKIAVKRKSALAKLQKDNERLEKELATSKEQITYRVHKRFNLIFLVIGIVFWGGLFLWNNLPEGLAKIKHQAILDNYYKAGQLEEIYWYMEDYELWGGRYGYGTIAFLWRSYEDAIEAFSKAHEAYVNEGEYDKDAIEEFVFEAYSLLTAEEYYNLNDSEMAILKPYKDEVVMILTGAFKVPMEEIDILISKGYEGYEEEEAFAAYVSGVAMNEQ